MISAGNDIVALNAINIARTKQPRFYSKILSASEIKFFYSPPVSEIPLEIFVWLLWSVKEAAFKYLQRLNPALVFTPVKFIVTALQIPVDKSFAFIFPKIEGIGFDGVNVYKGKVRYGDDSLYFTSVLHPDFIHTVVSIRESFENIYWGIKYISDSSTENQSAEVRSFLLDTLKKLLADDNITIEKTSTGIPLVCKQNTAMELPVSLAHHDNWVAYVFNNL